MKVSKNSIKKSGKNDWIPPESYIWNKEKYDIIYVPAIKEKAAFVEKLDFKDIKTIEHPWHRYRPTGFFSPLYGYEYEYVESSDGVWIGRI
jgi:hypothetical protein